MAKVKIVAGLAKLRRETMFCCVIRSLHHETLLVTPASSGAPCEDAYRLGSRRRISWRYRMLVEVVPEDDAIYAIEKKRSEKEETEESDAGLLESVEPENRIDAAAPHDQSTAHDCSVRSTTVLIVRSVGVGSPSSSEPSVASAPPPSTCSDESSEARPPI